MSYSVATSSRSRLPLAAVEVGLHWLSVLLRAAIGSLLLIAGLMKVPNGVSGTVAYYRSVFENSILPEFLVTGHASVILFVELAVGIWLLSGFRLALAWKVAGALLLSLAIGMVFAGQYPVASDNYIYALLCGVGLLTVGFDRWQLGSRSQSVEQRE